jgi:signal transduction histidine kinase/CheY-like chemotaxis protein
MNTPSGFDFTFPIESLKPTVLVSVLSVWVLVGVCYYLNRYTKRRYFAIWTAGWACYSLWLALSLVQPSGGPSPLVRMAQQCCVGIAAVFLLWGSALFLNLPVRGRTFGLLTAFLVVWSYLGTFHVAEAFPVQVAIFGLISLASLMMAWAFYQFRQQRKFLGAGLLAMGFALWAVYLAGFPALQRSPDMVSAAFFISAVLQLFIAVSMIVLVLEEVRSARHDAVRKLRLQRHAAAQMRSQARSTEQRYRSLFEQAHEGIIIADAADLRIVELNPAAKHLLGVAELNGEPVRLSAFVHASANGQAPVTPGAEWFAWLQQHPALHLTRADGHTVPVELDGARVNYDDRPAYQFFVRELTERARLEQQLRQAEKLSALGQMISGVSHELNNPLTVIKGYLELILSRHRLEEATRADLEKVAHVANRAAKLVNKFLTFARQQPATRRVIELNQLIREVVELHQFELRVMGIEVRFDLDPLSPQTLADPDQIQQVLLNLVNNALHAMADLPGPGRLTLRSRRQGELALVHVEDTGRGVPDHLVTHIFEPFFTTKEVGTGTGLGLSICHSIMSEHHGRIHYERPPEGGARFVLEFPSAAAPKTADAGPAPAEPTPTPPPPAPDSSALGQAPAAALPAAHILVLDDEKAIAEMLAEMLSMLGHTPTLCHAATHALELVEKHDFDLILSDIRMPVMDGKKFYQTLKQQKPHLAERVVFLTGDTVNDETRGFLEATGNRHLGKPFRLAAVEETVEQTLRSGHRSFSPARAAQRGEEVTV